MFSFYLGVALTSTLPVSVLDVCWKLLITCTAEASCTETWSQRIFFWTGKAMSKWSFYIHH